MVEVKSVVKKYGDKVALNGISFTVEDRGVRALLGPRGSGKSTLLNIITGCLEASDGEVLISGINTFDMPTDVKKKMAYMPECFPFYENMTPYEFLVFIGEARRVPYDKLYRNIKSIMELTRINEISGKLIKTLSAGDRQLLGIAQALLGNPDVIVLDEPMQKLDDDQKAAVKTLIKKLGEHKCVIVSTAELSDVTDICDELIIISNGDLIVKDTLENLEKRLIKTRAISVSIKGDEDIILPAIKSVEGISSCIITGSEGGVVSMKLEYGKSTEIRGALFAALANISCPILSMVERSLTLSDVYLQLVDAELAEVSECAEAAPSKPRWLSKFKRGGKRK